MRSVALLPSIAILAGTCAGVAWAQPLTLAPRLLSVLWLGALVAWVLRRSRLATLLATLGYAVAGAALGADAAARALDPPLRAVLDRELGGFALATLGPPPAHAPVPVRARLLEDAAVTDFGVSMRVAVERIALGSREQPAGGGVRLTIVGEAAARRAGEWRGGRLIDAPMTFRRPARYLNDGVADFERDLALDGIALTASVKSGLLVEVVRRGSAFEEVAALIRAHVRAAAGRWIGRRDPLAAAIVTAILIGDRNGLPDDVRGRLQAAGTYHVIAISGGNIAILAALIAGLALAAGASGRGATAAIIAGLLAYAAVVSAGPSVWRATATAVACLAARLVDHRSPPWNAMAVSAALIACVTPLDVSDVGFALTFGATAAILEAARRTSQGVGSGSAPQSAASGPASVNVASGFPGRPRALRGGGRRTIGGPRASGLGRTITTWIVASIAASLAAEIVLLPIVATAFSRVTVAGLALNLIAIPLMTLAQMAGLVVACADRIGWIASGAGYVAALAAEGLVESARLVEVAPWLTLRVPPPSPALVVAYYIGLGSALWWRRGRKLATLGSAACAALILSGRAAPVERPDLSRLRLTVFDVGQGDAMLLTLPGGRTVMVDTGGAGIDGLAFDIGGRVLGPALWARGVRRLDILSLTHGDPDHIGGARALLHDFAPGALWEGVPVARHVPLQAVRAAARDAGVRLEPRLAGDRITEGPVRIRVLHPPPPDWERPRVRNDDSLVLEVRYGDASLLLTGDIGAEIERLVIPQLAPARIRILKVAHHGSRTSTSQELLDAWQPQIALISCGRGNRFGHPAPEVVQRLEAAGVQILRTDRDGQITLDTDGRDSHVRTFMGGSQ